MNEDRQAVMPEGEKLRAGSPAARVGLFLLAAYAVFSVWNIHLNKDTYQWDFKAHYYAGRAHALGQNPYDRALLKHIAGWF